MHHYKYIVLDFETGGLNPEKDAITQVTVFAADEMKLKKIDELNLYVWDETKAHDPKALSHSGIKIADLKEMGVNPKKAYEELVRFFKAHRGSTHPSTRPMLAGHNITFDIGFLNQLFKENKDNPWEYLNEGFIDTMLLAKLAHQKEEDLSLSLSSIYKHTQGDTLNNAHNSYYDVEATLKLLKHYVLKLRNTSEQANEEEALKKDYFKFQF